MTSVEVTRTLKCDCAQMLGCPQNNQSLFMVGTYKGFGGLGGGVRAGGGGGGAYFNQQYIWKSSVKAPFQTNSGQLL